MLRLFSLFAILAGSATMLIYAGQGAFGNEAVNAADGPLYAFFKALPVDTAYGAPLVGIGIVAAGYMVLRLLGFLISVVGGAVILAMIGAVFFKPEWVEAARKLAE
ncbi:MAG: hypothetical protein ACR2O4_03225 [Hyphomicrobiaceae bacterium]